MSRVLVLMYHQVDLPRTAREARFCTRPQDFDQQMRWLQENGYTAVSLDVVVAHVRGQQRLPEKAIHITFDDGFVGVLEHAWPVLEQRRIPATLFVVSERLAATNDWMHTRGFPRRAILSPAQLRALADAGMTLGSHTCTHARLPEVDSTQAMQEIARSKAQLEDLLGQPVLHFAYPYGAFNEAVRGQVIAAGYQSACSTRSGFNRPGEDPYLIRRIDIYGTDRLWQFQQKLRFGMNDAARTYPLRYYLQRLQQRIGI